MDNSTRQTQNTPPKPRRLIDNAAEVRRRKEAAERLIRERHEALRRQHEEKIHKINEERLRQQRELKERHAKELKRQQDVLQRRMALMERDKARKQEILEKNHAVASRLSTASSRKNYAFGSSTPRELSFLDSRLIRMNAMEAKRASPEKQGSPPNGPVNARRGRSMASVLSTSLYASTNSDRARHTASVTRLSQPKSTPTKSPMTQSVYHPTQNATPASRLRRKPVNQVTASVPNTPLTGSTASSTTPKKVQPKPKPRGTPANAVNKKPPTPPEIAPSPQRRESLARSEDIPTPLGITASEPPRSENSFTSDEIPLEMADKEAHYEVSVESPIPEVNHNEETKDRNVEENHQIASEAEETTHVSEVDVVIEPPAAAVNHIEQASEEEAAIETTKDIIVADPNAVIEEQLISPVPKSSEVETVPVAEIASVKPPPPQAQEGGASLADELAGVFGGPSPTPLVELSAEDTHTTAPVEHLAKELAAEPVKEMLIDHPPAENDAEKPVEIPSVEKSPENQPAIANPPVENLVDLVAEKHTENPPVEKVAENPPMEKLADKPPVEKVPENPPTEKLLDKSPVESYKSENVSVENPLIDFHTNEDEVTSVTKVTTTERVHTEHVTNHVRTNGVEQQAPQMITADLPGTVPAKEVDESVMKKVPTPPNEFIAHRLRREQEQREIDERKARIAAILAKSRDLSSGTPIVAGRTSPPRGETAQDVLKRLASNGNLPALQKLVARRTPEPPTIDQIAPEDPAPQAI